MFYTSYVNKLVPFLFFFLLCHAACMLFATQLNCWIPAVLSKLKTTQGQEAETWLLFIYLFINVWLR